MHRPKEEEKEGGLDQDHGDRNSIRQLGNDDIGHLFAPLRQTTSSDEDIFGLLEKVVTHIHTLIKKEKMENEYIDTYRGRLSARQLLSQGKTLYMNPCLDLVLVTIEGLKKAGIQDIGFVIDELQCPGNRFKLHFGIEIKTQGKTYHINYKTKNTVVIGLGNFESDYTAKGEHIANTIYVSADQISADDNIYDLINRGLISFKYFDTNTFDMLREALKASNNETEWIEGFLAHIQDINKPEIIISGNAV